MIWIKNKNEQNGVFWRTEVNFKKIKIILDHFEIDFYNRKYEDFDNFSFVLEDNKVLFKYDEDKKVVFLYVFLRKHIEKIENALRLYNYKNKF